MYFSDNHTHSSCSPDGKAPMTSLVDHAVANGVEELTITDHCDLLSMEGTIELEFDWSPLRVQFAQAEEAARGRLRLNRGIEIGGASDFPAEADHILEERLDFVLGSVHNLSVTAGCKDFYVLDWGNDPGLCNWAMEDYLSSMERLVAWNGFDSLAHVPYPLRYFPEQNGKAITLAPWEDRIRAILRRLVENGKALELNTYRGRRIEDYRDLFRWYQEVGGELITLGSDAHNPADIGKGIREGQELLRELGFRWFCVYRKRKPVMMEL